MSMPTPAQAWLDRTQAMTASTDPAGITFEQALSHPAAAKFLAHRGNAAAQRAITDVTDAFTNLANSEEA